MQNLFCDDDGKYDPKKAAWVIRKASAILMVSLLCACSGSKSETQDVKNELSLIHADILAGKTLTGKQQCISDHIVGTIVDRKNIAVYGAVFDVLSRAFISVEYSLVDGCIPLVSGGDGLPEEAKLINCPDYLFSLSKEQLTELNTRAESMINAAENFEGSLFFEIYGSCIEK